ncbi:MAG TPA: DUF475 domain-containing protein [Streptosporangiaceae bacterium]
MLALFRLPIAVTIVGIVVAGIVGGPSIAGIVAILAILEVSLSFDNAVVNATVLQRMNPYWQRIFLTVGILIAVFGMRLLFPLIVVTIAGHISPVSALDLALHHPHQYAAKLTEAHPAIGAFGGIFLLMIFLDFLFEDQDIKWLVPLERPLAKIGKLDQASVIIALIFLTIAATTFGQHDTTKVLLSGVAGLATYLAVSSLSALFESEEEAVVGGEEPAGDAASDAGESGSVKVPANLARLGLFTFLYLEVLDASFSFDGVVGAFAITDMIFVIALGLGIGACYIRALTVYLVRKGTLAEYVYLEHGAHWAIGALAVLLFVTIRVKVPDLVTGLIGVGFIGAALISSIVRNRREFQEIEPTVLPEPLGT